MRHRTLGYLTALDAKPAEIVTAAAAAGFDSVGLRIIGRRAGDDFPDLVNSVPAIRDMRSLLAATGMRLANVTGSYIVEETKPDDLKRLASAADQLGAAYIALTAYDREESRIIARLAELSEWVAPTVRIGLEFVPYSAVRTIFQAERIVEATAAGNLGLRLDALHLIRSGGSPADIAKVDASHIFYAQVCDGPIARPATEEALIQESRSGRLFPKEGELPLDDFLDALAPDLEIEIEAPHPLYRDRSVNDRAAAAYDALDRLLNEHRHVRSEAS